MLTELKNNLGQEELQVSQGTWSHLLQLKELLKETSDWTTVSYNKSRGFNFGENDKAASCKISKKNIVGKDWNVKSCFKDQFYLGYERSLDSEAKEFFDKYLPVILLGAVQKNRPSIIVHMAQSLDGKVCTQSGNSKWIGNDENLIHAHRLRALVDSVMVGGNTLANDLPRLNVRHVPGNNPKRVFLSNRFTAFDKLPEVEGAEVILLRNCKEQKALNGDLKITQLNYSGQTTEEQIGHILDLLKGKEINTLMIEGGPDTVSSFFKCGVVDWLQVHIAPKLFGSGKSMIALPEICQVAESHTLDNVQYNIMGDGLMVTGELNTNNNQA